MPDAKAETSDRVSAIAARYRTFTAQELMAAADDPERAERVAVEVRSMAASLQRQDETKGLRGS